jgi:hypothetical protein
MLIARQRIPNTHQWIYDIYNGGSLHNNISEKNKIDTTVSAFVYWLLTLHVLTLMLDHHWVYNNTSISS